MIEVFSMELNTLTISIWLTVVTKTILKLNTLTISIWLTVMTKAMLIVISTQETCP